MVRGELDAYGADLADKPEIVALSRADLVDAKQLAKVKKALDKASGGDAIPISAPTGQGIEALLDRDRRAARLRADQPTEAAADERPWSPL